MILVNWQTLGEYQEKVQIVVWQSGTHYIESTG